MGQVYVRTAPLVQINLRRSDNNLENTLILECGDGNLQIHWLQSAVTDGNLEKMHWSLNILTSLKFDEVRWMWVNWSERLSTPERVDCSSHSDCITTKVSTHQGPGYSYSARRGRRKADRNNHEEPAPHPSPQPPVHRIHHIGAAHQRKKYLQDTRL